MPKLIFHLVKELLAQNQIFIFSLKDNKYLMSSTAKNGGAMRDRTADLLRAKQALSQLSYSPILSTNLGYSVRETHQTS